MCAVARACPGAQAETPVELVIPNFEASNPACHVRVAVKDEKCADQSCTFTPVKGVQGVPTELRFICFPMSAATGFENPPPYAKITAIRAKSSKGAVSVIDDINTPPASRVQELNFCLHGTKNNLCGNATASKIHGRESPVLKQIRALIKRIDWDETAPK